MQAQRRRQRRHPEGIQGRLQAIGRGRLGRHLGAGRIRRPGSARHIDRDRQRIPRFVQSRLLDVSGPGAGRGGGGAPARLRRAQEEVPTKDDNRRMGRHHESDRAALRHRSRPVAHQGGEAAGWQLQAQRHQDLHFRRRAGSDREHHPSRARAHRRRAGRHQGHFALHRAEGAGERRRLARRQERRQSVARSKRRWAFTAIPPA